MASTRNLLRCRVGPADRSVACRTPPGSAWAIAQPREIP